MDERTKPSAASRHARSFVRDEDGSALITVLAFVVLLSTLVGVLWMVHVAQYRFIRRDAHRAMARYAAEAGLYVALDSLERNPYWQHPDTLVGLPDGQQARLSVEPFGAYLYVRSVAQQGRSQAAVRALVGEVPAESFGHGVVLWDTESSLHVAGDTRLAGRVTVGPRGVRERTFKRRRFTGEVDGPVYEVENLEAPFADMSFFAQAVDAAERQLREAHPSPADEDDGFALRSLARHLPSTNPVVVERGRLRLTPADAERFRRPLTVVATGDLEVEGPLHLLPGTTLIAGRTLTVEGRVTGEHLLLYGRQGVALGDSVRCAAQVFSDTHIRVQGSAYLTYPSVLYVTGAAANEGGAIRIEDDAIVDGTVVYPPLEERPFHPSGRIRIEEDALVRGAVFNAHETELRGTVWGSVLTHQFYFYESPTSYVNWLLDATVEWDERPRTYLLPLRFGTSPHLRLGVIAWDAVVDEVEGLLVEVPA